MIERHIEELRPDPRSLSRRALRTCAAKQPADIAEATWAEWRPAEQARAENAERDCHREFALDAGKGRERKSHNAAANLDWPRETSAAARKAGQQRRRRRSVWAFLQYSGIGGKKHDVLAVRRP